MINLAAKLLQKQESELASKTESKETQSSCGTPSNLSHNPTQFTSPAFVHDELCAQKCVCASASLVKAFSCHLASSALPLLCSCRQFPSTDLLEATFPLTPQTQRFHWCERGFNPTVCRVRFLSCGGPLGPLTFFSVLKIRFKGLVRDSTCGRVLTASFRSLLVSWK